MRYTKKTRSRSLLRSKNKTLGLIAAVLICLASGFTGFVATAPSIPTWYAGLHKPVFNPPNWIFGPIWTTLFILMGVAAFIVWDKGIKQKKIKLAISVFAVQLILNSLWSFLFFYFHSPFYAFLELILLWCAILWTMILFHKISKIASLLMLPYILWVSFAGVLNFSIFLLNK
jgi:translocator protein